MDSIGLDDTSVVLYITKINTLVTEGREDLIAAIIADYQRGADAPEAQAPRS